jgi:hypothetical protein
MLTNLCGIHHNLLFRSNKDRPQSRIMLDLDLGDFWVEEIMNLRSVVRLHQSYRLLPFRYRSRDN